MRAGMFSLIGLGCVLAMLLGYFIDRQQHRAYLDAKLPDDFDSEVRPRRRSPNP